MGTNLSKEAASIDRRLRTRTVMTAIFSAGYDALCAILELEFLPDGQVWQFYDVPEHIWYDFKKSESADIFFHANIAGQYAARQIQ